MKNSMNNEMQRFHFICLKGFLFIMLFPILILSIVVFCIEIDLSAPSFPAMASYFGVDEGMIQYTIAINFVGFCIASLFYGALSDAYGRRPIMIFGAFLLMLGGIGCVASPSIEWFLLARFIQGLGASAAAVVAFTMIADVYSGHESIRRISILNSLVTVVMAVAPIIGSLINDQVGWQWNLITIALISCLSYGLMFFGLQETHHKLQPFCPSKLLKDYKYVFSNSTFLNASAVPSLLAALYMAFVACAAFLYTQTFGLSVKGYALHQGIIVAVFSLVSFFIDKILKKAATLPIIKGGLTLIIVGMVGLTIVGYVNPASAILTSLFMCIIAIGDAIVYPIVFSLSLEIFKDHKGVVMSAIMFCRTLMIAAITGLMGTVYDGSLLSFVWVGYIAFIPAVVCTMILTRRNFFKQEESVSLQKSVA